MTTDADPDVRADTEEASRLGLLLVEDNPDDAQMFVDLISEHIKVPIELSLATTLAKAIEFATSQTCDVVLLDLSLPDSDGPTTFRKMYEAAPNVPIVVLTGLDSDDVALNALGEGAQDYLVKGQMDGHLLMRAIRYAVERQHLIQRLKEADHAVATLAEMLPVCTSCKKVKCDDGSWADLEVYLREHSKTRVQQTLCPVCGRRFR